MKLVLNGINVGLVDERGEISGLYKGIIRSMAPQVVVADEIGTYEDIKAIKEAVCSRCKGHFYGTWRRKRRTSKKSSIKRTSRRKSNRKVLVLR